MVVLFLFLVPVFASALLGLVFVLFSDAGPGWKASVVVIFGLAAYLQFFSRHTLAGLLLQIGLALALALWKRFDSGV